jgi:hypothetical protein
VEAWNEGRKEDDQRLLWHAWMGEYFTRVKELRPLKEYLEPKKEDETPSDMAERLKTVLLGIDATNRRKLGEPLALPSPTSEEPP